MATIDKGEKHIFKRRLLESDDSPIIWDNIIDVTFDLMIRGLTVSKTWSKSNGDVSQAQNNYVEFELDSQEYAVNDYYIRAELEVYDDRFDSGTARDITWETEKITITSSVGAQNSSSSTADIKFDVVVEDAVSPPENAPTIATFSTDQTTATTANIPYTEVVGATSYQYELQSGGGAVNNQSNLSVQLTGLTSNATDSVRVRGLNSAGPGPWSAYSSFTTNPSVSPTVDGSITTTTNTATIPLVDEGLEVEYDNGNGYVSAGLVTSVSLTGLLENTSFDYNFRYRNAGGVGPVSVISFTTQQAPPTVAPAITLDTINQNGADFTRTSVAGADDYEASVDGGAYSSIGLSTSYSITGIAGNTTFSHVIRATNDGGNGPDSNELTVLTLTDEAPVVTLTEATSTTLTLNVSDISGDGTTTLYLNVNGAGYEVVTVGDNTFTGLPSETSITVLSRADNASGTGAFIGSYSFDTAPDITEPTWDNGSFANTVDTVTVRWSGSTSDYLIRETGVGASFTTVTGTSYTFEGRSPADSFQVELRATDGVNQSASIFIDVQTDGFTVQEESTTGKFQTAST